jgi:hypothetical protein
VKDLWTTLPTDNPIRGRIERMLSADISQADAWRNAAGIAWPAGYDIAEPPRTFGEKLIALRKSDPKAAGRLMIERSEELASERAAARSYAGRRAWAAGPPQSELDSKRIAAKDAAEIEATVEARAQHQVAEQAAKNLEAARKTVRREMPK